MTNKEDEGDSNCDPRIAGLLAVHLVSQVLDEAYVIANAATESGQPWRYLAMLKSLRSGPIIEVDEENETFNTSKGDEDTAEGNMVSADNVVATSTPQKVTDENIYPVNETSIIGQGDEESDLRRIELSNSTSMFINHLFDMSEVERVIMCDDTEIIQNDSIDLITEAMTKIMESYVNTALSIAFERDVPNYEPVTTGNKSPSTEYSGYSFLADADTAEFENDMAFCIDNELSNNDVESTPAVVTEMIEHTDQTVDEEAIKKDDVAFYEHTYLTLNRDYDQCSDDDGDPVLQDPKGMSMQEVQLMAAETSDENTPRVDEPLEKNSKEFTAISAVSASASGSRKSSLVQRCRSQGARLLSCLRGWWRRKTPGKRKEARVPGSMRGLCPLSPDARRRAASLLDQRKLCSTPPPAQHVVWKFNTVSEALVNSTRWKNYTFDVDPDECGEY